MLHRPRKGLLHDEVYDAVAAGPRCIQSTSCSISNAQEVSAPLAELYIELESLFYCSVGFQNIHVRSCMEFVLKVAAIDIVLSQAEPGSDVMTFSSYLDYIHRPAQLEEQNLMTFIRLFRKENAPAVCVFCLSMPSIKRILFIDETSMLSLTCFLICAVQALLVISRMRNSSDPRSSSSTRFTALRTFESFLSNWRCGGKVQRLQKRGVLPPPTPMTFTFLASLLGNALTMIWMYILC